MPFEIQEFLHKRLKGKKKKEPKEPPLKDYALDKLTKAGMRFPDEPNAEVGKKPDEHNYLNLPRDITLVTNQDLGRYLNAFTQQKMFVLTLVSLAEVDFLDAEEYYKKRLSWFYDNAPYSNVNDRKHWATKKVTDIGVALAKAQSVLSMATRNLESIDSAIFLISREIARRDKLMEQEKREHRLK